MTATPIDLVADLGAADQPSPPRGHGAGGGRTSLGCASRRQGQSGGGHRGARGRRRARAPRACARPGQQRRGAPGPRLPPRSHRVALASERRRRRSATGAHAHVRPPDLAAGAAARAGGRRRRFGAHGRPAAPADDRAYAHRPGAGGHARGRGARGVARQRSGADHRAHPGTDRRRARRAQLRHRTARQGQRQRHLARGVERAAPRADGLLALRRAVAGPLARGARPGAATRRRRARRRRVQPRPSSAPPTRPPTARTSRNGRWSGAISATSWRSDSASMASWSFPRRWRCASNRAKPSSTSWSASKDGCRRDPGW